MKLSFLLLVVIIITLVIFYTQGDILFNSETFVSNQDILIINNDLNETIKEINLDPDSPSYIYEEELNDLFKLKTKIC